MSKRIMVIDDDEEFLEELKETLVLSGYELVASSDPLGALDMAKKTRPDVILLDLKMPNKSGFQVAGEFKNLSEVSRIPIIAMTAFYKDDYKDLIAAYGIQHCLQKPFNPLDVITRIEDACKENGHFTRR